MEIKRYNKYLDPRYLSKIRKFSLRVKEIVEGFISGLHKSSRFGINVEFRDHRAYNQGDDLKYIDWRLYAKTDRYYIKRFNEESNLNLNIFLDTSSSMKFKYSGTLSKMEYSKYITGSLLYLSVIQNDYAGLTLFSNRISKTFTPSKRLVYINNVLNELEKVKPAGISEFKKTFIYLSEKIKKKSLVIIISDFLHPVEKIIEGVKFVKSKKNDVILFVINDKVELDFAFKDNIKFIDMEMNDTLTLNPLSIKEEYLNSITAHYKTLENFAKRSDIDIHYFDTTVNFEEILYNYLLKRSKYV
ncbi:MAG: DUF58 domain-containing protein [Spirochaetes bacterium]|nr:DUF58 domain-containing protein [Spirochaetota bacterium]